MQKVALLLCLLLAPLAVTAQEGEGDPGFLAGLLQDALSDAGRDVRIVGFEGALSSRATIRSLSISDDEGEWFRAENVVLDWDRSALLRGRIDVNRFGAERVALLRLPEGEDGPPAAEATPFSIPELPVSVEIAELAIPSLFVGAPVAGEEVSLALKGAASLVGGGADIRLLLERQDGPRGIFRLNAGYDPQSRTARIDLLAEEARDGVVARLLGIPDRPSLRFRVVGNGEIEAFSADIALQTNGVDRLAGTLDLVAPEATEDWGLVLDLTGDPSPLIVPELQDFLGSDVALKARVDRQPDGTVLLPEFTLAARALSLSGEAALAGTGWPVKLDVQGEIAAQSGPVPLPFAGGDARVDRVVFELDYDQQRDNRLTVNAEMDALQSPAAAIETARLRGDGRITPPAAEEPGLFDLNLDWRLAGLDLADPALADAVGQRIEGSAALAYRSDQPLRLENLEISGPQYGLFGRAIWRGEEDIPLELSVRLQAEDIARFAGLAGRDLGGEATLDIEGAVGPISGLFDVTLDGTTRSLAVGQPVLDRAFAGVGTVTADLRRDQTGTTIRSALVATDAIRIDAAGQISSDVSGVQLDFSVPDLGRLFPGEAAGRAAGTGNLRFRGATLIEAGIDADLASATGPVRLPVADGLRLDRSAVRIGFGQDGGDRWTARLLAQDLATSAARIARASLAASGTLSLAETGGVQAVSGEAEAELAGLALADAAAGSAIGAAPSARFSFVWTDDSARVAIPDFTLTSAGLQATGSGSLSDDFSDPELSATLQVEAADLGRFAALSGQSLSGSGRADLDLGYGPKAIFSAKASGAVSNLGIGNPVIDPVLSGRLVFDGRIAGRGGTIETLRLEASGPEISASASGSLDRLEIRARLRDISTVAPDFRGALVADGTLRRTGEALGLDVELVGPGGTRLGIAGTIAGGDRTDLDISGNAPLGLANAFIAPRRVNGQAQIDLALTGPLALESLRGTISTTNAELTAPTLGISLAPVTGQVRLQAGRGFVDLLASGNNGGRVTLGGSLGLQGALVADLAARFDGFGIRDPNLYDTSVTGTLAIAGPLAGGASITGDLRLGRTEVSVPNSGVSALGDVPDIDHLGATRPVMRTLFRAGLDASSEESGAETARAPYSLNIRLAAPAQVFVRGRGLDAELGGSLRITGTTTDIIPIGGFELIRGRLDILNQRFVLDEGRIQLSGSFDPILRFVAVTDTNGITVSIIIDGPASSPDVRFTSTPELPEDEVLALLLFGRDLSDLSALQALELANAVATLAGRGGGGILSSLREGFGLDDLDVEQTEDGGTAVRAGKYISENVYSDIVVDSDGRSEINLNLDITPNITAKGGFDNSGESSLGIYFEKDY